MAFPGELLLIHLSETLLQKGIGGLLEPWQTRRVGRANTEVRAEEKVALAQAEIKIKDIREGRALLEDHSPGMASGLSGVLAPANEEGNNESFIDFRSIAETSLRQMVADSVQKEVNIAKAILHAEESLENDDQEPPEENIEDDWLNRWREYAGEVSSEKMQSLWGRLLSGELKTPGSYSLRCLDFLKNLSHDEAQKIAKLAPFAVEEVLWRDDKNMFESDGITLLVLMEMQQLGIMSGVEAVGISRTWNTNAPDRFLKFLRSNSKVIVVSHDDPNKVLTLPGYFLTGVGHEMLQLVKAPPRLDYLTSIGKAICKQGFSVGLGDYVQLSATQVKAFNITPIEPD